MRYLRTTIVAIAVALLPLMGCGSSNGSITLELTDAPGEGIEAAVATISEVYLQGNGGGRIVLRDEPITVDLMSLANETQRIVDEMPIPAGSYSQLRFVIDGAYVEADVEGQSRIYSTPGSASAGRATSSSRSSKACPGWWTRCPAVWSRSSST